MKKILLIIATFVFVWSVFVEPSVIRTVKYDVGGFGVNKKIVFISDLHLSKHDARRLARIVNRVNELKPDIVLLGGDYVKWDVSDSIPLEALSAGLSCLKAKDGVLRSRGIMITITKTMRLATGWLQNARLTMLSQTV